MAKKREKVGKTWGRKGTSNGIMGIWGEFVSVDYDICIADGFK